MAIHNIQAEMYKKAGRARVGDYSSFAARAESLFIDAGLFALDEYGIPLETARRLKRGRQEVLTLDAALDLLRSLDLDLLQNLHQFERELIANVLETLPRQRIGLDGNLS